MKLTVLCVLSLVSYERILSIQSLNDVANPWKGFTMNRCIALALLVVLVSSSMNELHGEFFFDREDAPVILEMENVGDMLN